MLAGAVADGIAPTGKRRQAEPNAQLPQVRGDRIQLQQVLLNLITNAIDSMVAKDGARILGVRSEVRDGANVIVSVADTGTGIGSQELERIFNPLFTTKSGGMGMGLSICRSIIEAHDGQLWVAPNKPEGAVFQFMLLADGATSARALRREQPDDLPLGSRLTDQIIDESVESSGLRQRRGGGSERTG